MGPKRATDRRQTGLQSRRAAVRPPARPGARHRRLLQLAGLPAGFGALRPGHGKMATSRHAACDIQGHVKLGALYGLDYQALLVMTHDRESLVSMIALQLPGHLSTLEHMLAGDLNNARWLFQAVALANGSALAVGGLGVASGGVLNSTELFVPSNQGSPTGTWQQVAEMKVARQDFAALLLPDGRVLAIGGFMAGAEIYDPDQVRLISGTNHLLLFSPAIPDALLYVHKMSFQWYRRRQTTSVPLNIAQSLPPFCRMPPSGSWSIVGS